MNCPFICSTIPAVPAYGVYISQMIGYSSACGSDHDLLNRGLLLAKKLPNQGFRLVKLQSSLRKCKVATIRNICVTNDHGYVPLVA